MHSRLRITAFLPLQNFAALPLSSAQQVSGKVVSITDGDTIEVLMDGKAEKVRLYGIDAREKSQAYGTKAKQLLRLQGEASAARQRPWRDIKQIPPWEFRQGKTTLGDASEGKRL